MESLKYTGEDDFEEYEKIFSMQLKAVPKAKTIMSLEVRELEKSAFEIALTLWDGTLTMASIPGCESSGNERFIVYYTTHVVAPSLTGQYIADLAFLSYNYDPELPLDDTFPSPAFNISNGVPHLEKKLTKQLQHLVIIPTGASSFCRSIEMIKKIYDLENYDQDAVDNGVEGCYTPSIQDIKKRLESLRTTIANLGYEKKLSIGVNIGASKFREDDTTYRSNFKEEIPSGDAPVKFYKSLVTELNVALIEDPFHVDDWEHCSQLTRAAEHDTQVVLENDCMVNCGTFWTAVNGKICILSS